MLYTLSTLHAKSFRRKPSVPLVTPTSIHVQEQQVNELPSFILSPNLNQSNEPTSIHNDEELYTDPLLQRIDLLKRANQLLTLSQSRTLHLSKKEKINVLSQLLHTCHEEPTEQSLDWIIQDQVDVLKSRFQPLWDEKSMLSNSGTPNINRSCNDNKSVLSSSFTSGSNVNKQKNVFGKYSPQSNTGLEKGHEQVLKPKKKLNASFSSSSPSCSTSILTSPKEENKRRKEKESGSGKAIKNNSSSLPSPENLQPTPVFTSHLIKRVQTILEKKEQRKDKIFTTSLAQSPKSRVPNLKVPTTNTKPTNEHSPVSSSCFVASPVPSSTLLPKYNELLKAKQQRKAKVHEANIERLNSILQPFQFAYSTFLRKRREEKKAHLATIQAKSKKPKQRPKIFRLAQSAALDGRKKFLQRQNNDQRISDKECTFKPKVNPVSALFYSRLKRRSQSPSPSCKTSPSTKVDIYGIKRQKKSLRPNSRLSSHKIHDTSSLPCFSPATSKVLVYKDLVKAPALLSKRTPETSKVRVKKRVRLHWRIQPHPTHSSVFYSELVRCERGSPSVNRVPCYSPFLLEEL